MHRNWTQLLLAHCHLCNNKNHFCTFPGPVENCQWTGWRDRDDPSATCDCEDILSSEVTLYDKCMGNVEKYKIQLVSGGPVYTDYTAVPTNKISFDSNAGWIRCNNSLQSNCPVNSNNNHAVDVGNPQYNCCKDYKVNYCCAPNSSTTETIESSTGSSTSGE